MFDGWVFSAVFVHVDGITLGFYVGTYLDYLYGSFEGSNYGNLEGVLLGGSLQSTYSKTGMYLC